VRAENRNKNTEELRESLHESSHRKARHIILQPFIRILYVTLFVDNVLTSRTYDDSDYNDNDDVDVDDDLY